MAPSTPGAEWRSVPSSGNLPAFSVYNKPIEKSPQDDREYRLLQLENGLQIALVSDPKGDKAAASLDVAVGHLHDPDDMPGLAHFCEHLLFMGTTEFPRENEYSEYLAKNSGSSNAFTSTTNTNYHFNVGPPALPGALARFASFFHSPLFSPSCTGRELNAVDSEHKKNHQADLWRIFQVNKHLSKPGHVWSKFGTGNRDTLERAARDLKRRGILEVYATAEIGADTLAPPASSRAPSPTPSEAEADGGPVGRETRRRLMEWWSEQYCASRMRLAVVGRNSLDELTEMVAPLFSPIPNRGKDPTPMFPEHPWGPDEWGTLVRVQTIMDFHLVEISMPIEWQPPYWEHKPASFLAHFVGHEGPGSLHSYLKQKRWITSLSSGLQGLARGFAMFKATIHLTKDGFDNHREVFLALFKYLSLLRSSEFESWKQDELALLSSTRFRFQEKSRPDSYTTWLSDHMAWPLPRDKLLSGPVITAPWRPDGTDEADVRRMLKGLRVDRARAVLMATKAEHDRLGGEQEWQSEPIYGTGFRVQRFDDAFLTEANGPNNIKDLFLPGHNKFIPTNLDVEKKEVVEPTRRPFLTRQTPLSTLWHKKDDQFWVPKAHVIMQILSPEANLSARHSVMTKLWAQLITDSLTEYAYDAELAGLNYNVQSDRRGIHVVISGYSDKLPVLAQRVLDRVRNINVTDDRLVVEAENARKSWQNFFLGQTYTMSNYFTSYLMSQTQWTQLEKLKELPLVTAGDIQAHIKNFMAKTHAEILVVGNMTKEDAENIAKLTESTLGSNALIPSEAADRSLVLPEGSNFVWNIPVPNPNEPNSALTYFMYIGDANDSRLRTTTALLAQILSEPAFNVLRTQEQLGYIVHCSQMVLARDAYTGMRVVVQSEREPAYLEQRVELFLSSMKERIAQMSSVEFEEQKKGLASKWRERLKNMREEVNRYWKYIEAGHFDFYRRSEDADLLDTITKDDVLALFNNKIDPTSPTRAKLSIHMKSQKQRPKKASVDAIKAFGDLLRDAGVEVDSWLSEVASGDREPVLSSVEDFWRPKLLGLAPPPGLDENAAKGLLDRLQQLAEQCPSQADSTSKVPDNAVIVEDPKIFKAALPVAADPKPVQIWGDLPTSRL